MLVDLAQFLKRKPDVPKGDRGMHVTLHAFPVPGYRKIVQQTFEDAETCAAALTSSSINEPQGHLLFVQGFPSAKWLSTIGAICKINPEFFNYFLRFGSRTDFFSAPSLPSTASDVIRFRFVTIADRTDKTGSSRQDVVDKLRNSARDRMRGYQNDLWLGREVTEGDSIVRRYSVLDEKHIVIEQDVLACLNRLRNPERWLGKFIASRIGERED